jgi:predicted ATP-grasp superfamily ATP-dependent carboligase
MKIRPYKRHSKSCRALRHSFGWRGFLIVDPAKTPRGRELVMNWGSTKEEPTAVCTWLNAPEKVKVASDKLATFTTLKAANVMVPDFTADINVAKGWIADDKIVLARKRLNGHSGQGIKVCKTVEEIPEGYPLYVKYVRKESEFRVHVFRGQVIDYVQKKKREGISDEEFNKYIRSYNNGWVFCRDDIEDSAKVKEEAIKAVAALGLDFGAVDIVKTNKNKVFVLEVNTAPALEGTTVEKYKAAVLPLLGQRG